MDLKNKITLTLSSFLFLFFISCQVSPNNSSETPIHKPHPLIGAWEMQQVHWISSDTTVSIKETQPGIFILSDTRYSIIWTRTRTPRVPFKILSAPSDDEIKAGFQSIVFNTGTYELKDSSLITTAKVAKVPGFEGGKQFYDFKIEGDKLTLTMTDETYPNGEKPEWSGKWKTQFVMTKAIK